MSAANFDVIVIGLGGMGSAACYELAARGLRVLGLEQFGFVHDRGSSHGHTRIIRTAYFEHPGYVPVLQRAWGRWYDLEQASGVHLLTECGCLNIGRHDGDLVRGVQHSAKEHGLLIDVCDALEMQSRFPQFEFGEEYQGVYEHQAGSLHVEECVHAHLDGAKRAGAQLHDFEPVREWTASNAEVRVRTEKGEYRAAKLVITAGPWAGQLLAHHGRRLRVMRQAPHWFGTSDDRSFRRYRCPVYIAEIPDGYYYGFPVIDRRGHKIARHYGANEIVSVDEIDRTGHPHDEAVLREFISKHVPKANGALHHSEVCIYTLSPDRHFIIDRHPEHPNVAIATGFSGHGFKFAPVVGEILADLTTQGRTDLVIDMFRMTRFGSP